MNLRPLKIDAALRALPDADVLAPLKAALMDGARGDAAGPFGTVESRAADPAVLEARVGEIADAVRARTEAVLRASVDALRAVEAGDWAEAARALVRAGEEEERGGRLADAERFYARAAELGRRPRDRSAEALALRRRARAARGLGRWGVAARAYEQAYRVASAIGDVDGVVAACQGMGNVSVDRACWGEALGWYRLGMERSPDDAPSVERVHLCNGLAVAERRLGRMDAAAAWLEEAGRTAAAVGDAEVPGYVENGWGMLHLARGHPAQAEEAFRRALLRPLAPGARASVLVNLSEALLARGRARDAEGAAREAEALALHHAALFELAEAYRALGEVARVRGERDGMVFFEQALAICREHGLPPFEEAVTQLRYARFEAALGDRAAAAARLDEAVRLFGEAGAEGDARAAAREREALAGDDGETNGGA